MMRLLDKKDDSAGRAAGFLRTVAHAGRLRIVCALMQGERVATDLTRLAQLTAPSLSQQAAILEAGGIIARRREGRSVLYRLSAPEARALARFLYRMFCKAPAASRRRRSPGRTRS